jgi:AcrR family transcriptional regulator
MNPRIKTSLRGRRLGRVAWLDIARETLIETGIESVTIGSLARKLNATRPSFYYHFKDRAALLRDLVQYWEIHNTAPFEQAIKIEGGNGYEKFNRIINIWLEEKAYSPKFDSAMRDWARNSAYVARAVHRIDGKRIEILKSIYLELGFEESVAFIRARVTYFHQVGYYALGLSELRKDRHRLAPLYVDVLLGR